VRLKPATADSRNWKGKIAGLKGKGRGIIAKEVLYLGGKEKEPRHFLRKEKTASELSLRDQNA